MENDQWTSFLIKQQVRFINVGQNPCIIINLTKLKQLDDRRTIRRSSWGCFIDKHIGDISMSIIITDDWSLPPCETRLLYQRWTTSRSPHNIPKLIFAWSTKMWQYSLLQMHTKYISYWLKQHSNSNTTKK